jgi:glutamyl-tRNA reductase
MDKRDGSELRASGEARRLFVLGTSQCLTSAAERERLHVDLVDAYRTLDRLRNTYGVLDEALPIVTCGRIEVYCVAPDVPRAVDLIRALVSRVSGVARGELETCSYVLEGHDAVRHLLRVASGLDSVIHGEAQILGQVREALNHPSSARTAGPLLHRLFERAIATGKRVRTETEIGRGAASVASAALSLLKERGGSLESASVLVLGAGDTGALVARLVSKEAPGRLVIANRTLERAQHVAEALGAEAVGLTDLDGRLEEADVVVGALSSSQNFLSAADLERLEPGRGRVFIDLAHPRNFAPDLEGVDGVTLLDLQRVFDEVASARAARAAQVPQAEAIVVEEASNFRKWLKSRDSVSVLRALRDQVLDMAEAEASRQARGCSHAERERMQQFARSLARSILHPPTVALRGADASSREGRFLLESAAVLFGLDDSTRSRRSA